LSTGIRSALPVGFVGALAAVVAIGLASPTTAAGQPGPTAPPPGVVCPAIEEDGLLCSNDPMSGNCEDFVTAAAQLGALYRSELARLPGSQTSLLSTNWWGCGPDSLADVKALLVRIGTPRAQLVLKDEPYASLAGPAPPPPPPGLADPQLNCVELSSPAERNACIGARLQAARAEHQRVFERCRDLVPPGLRDDLVQDEASFTALLPARCGAQAAGQDDEGLAAFERSRCLEQALTDNTRGMLAAHPECAAPE
jgi:hypothetical protein